MADERDEDLRDDLVEGQAESDAQHDPAPAVDPETEAEARKYGWRPKDEFNRDPSNWVDAERYLELPKTAIRIMRAEKDAWERERAALREEQHRTSQTVRAALDQQRREAEQRHAAEIDRIRSEMRAAAETGDVQKFDQLSQRERQMQPPRMEQPREPQLAPDAQAYLDSDRGKWTRDPEMLAWGARVINESPELMALPAIRQFEVMERKAREFFPDRFQQQPTPQPKPQAPQRSRVDEGGLASGQNGNAKGWDSLPPAARQAAGEFFEDPLDMFRFKENPSKARERYAKMYWNQGNV